MTQISDQTIIYQLEKVDQAGCVTDLLEDRLHAVAEGLDLEIEENEESPHYGEIKLPDGRYAGLSFEAYVTD